MDDFYDRTGEKAFNSKKKPAIDLQNQQPLTYHELKTRIHQLQEERQELTKTMLSQTLKSGSNEDDELDKFMAQNQNDQIIA